MKLLIGHVGEPLAGKETVSKLIAERAKCDGLSVGWIQFRDPLQETLELLGILRFRNDMMDPQNTGLANEILKRVWDIHTTPENVRAFLRLMSAHFGNEGKIVVDRPNLQKLAVVMRPLFGPSALSHAVFSRVKRRDEDIVQADGIRWLSDEQELRQVPGAIMLYTTASFEIRSARAKSRKKEGEEHKSIEQLRLEEQAENERYIGEIGSRADHRIVNESDSLDILKDEIEKFYMTHAHPRLSVTGSH
jgi:dephospho-CoA kinase